MGGESASGKGPWLLLLPRSGNGGLIVGIARRAALAVTVATVLATIAIAEAATIAIAETKPAIVPLAIAIDLAHHRGWAFLVLVDPNGEVAQHILAQPFLALDLVERG